MKPPNQITDEQLREYSNDHLVYEIGMLFWSADLLWYIARVDDKGKITEAINNALLNSFSIHARNLIDFLYSRSENRDKPSDIVVEDYIQDPSLYTKLPPITELLKKARKKTNKQVSHLTKERLDFEKEGKDWEFMKIYRDVMKALLRISDLFPKERVTDRFLEQTNKKAVPFPAITITQHKEEDTWVGVTLTASLKKIDATTHPYAVTVMSNTKSLAI